MSLRDGISWWYLVAIVVVMTLLFDIVPRVFGRDVHPLFGLVVILAVVFVGPVLLVINLIKLRKKNRGQP